MFVSDVKKSKKSLQDGRDTAEVAKRDKYALGFVFLTQAKSQNKHNY